MVTGAIGGIPCAMAKPTINDVALLAGVSKKTVSRVINRSPLLTPGTRARVEAIIAELGFVPNPQARALALGRSALIVLVHAGSDIELVGAALQGMQAALEGSEFAVAVLGVDPAGPHRHERFQQFIEQHRPHGAVLLPPTSEDEPLVALCRQLGCNHVRIAANVLDDPAHLVRSNDRQAATEATRYLVELGHRRIGFVAGPEHCRSARERELGYIDALADFGLDRGADLAAGGDGNFATGRAAGQLLLEVSPRPTAIFASSDAMAAGVIHAAAERGIAVPGQLSVIGFGDTAIAAALWPPLTTLHLPVAEMAGAAVLKLANPLSDEPAPFRCLLVTRGSVAPPQACSG